MSWGQKKIHPQKAGGSQRGLERRSRNKGVVIKFINIPLKTFKIEDGKKSYSNFGRLSCQGQNVQLILSNVECSLV